MEKDRHLRITAILLTVMVMGVIMMMFNAPRPTGQEDQIKKLALTLRPLAIQSGSSAQLEGLLEGDADTHDQFIGALDEQLEMSLRVLILSRTSPQTDSSFALGSAMAAAYGADALAWEILEGMRIPSPETQDMKKILWVEGSKLPAIQDTLFSMPAMVRTAFSPERKVTLTYPTVNGPKLALLPKATKLRLQERGAVATGNTQSLKELTKERNKIEMKATQGVAYVTSIPLIGGLIGLIFLLYHRRIRAFLKTYPGLSDTSLFPTDGLRIYLVLLGWFSFSLAFAILSQEGGPLGFLAADPGANLVLATLVSGIVSLVLISQVAPQKRGTLPSALGLHTRGFERREWILLALGLGGYCVAVPVTAGLSTLTQMFTGETPVLTHPIIWMLAEASGPDKVFMLILGASVLAPIFEEILFRGFLFQILRDRIGGTLSILASSLIFAALHPSAYTILPLFGLSCILCLLYARTGSLWPSILLHALHNSVSVLMVLFTLGG